jgi:hypothetical protein
MLVIFVGIVGMPMCLSFHTLSLLPGLGRILEYFYVMLSLLSLGVNHGNWLTFFVEFVSLGDPSMRMFNDGVGMYEYLLCTILGCGSAS